MSKRYYESYIIIDGNLEDSAIDEEIKKYESFFRKNEIEVNNLDRMGRKRLAYPIKKRLNGFYVCFEMTAPPQTITKLEKTYKLDDNILRYLTVYMSPKTIREKEDHLRNKAIIQSKYEESKNILAAAENSVPVSEVVESVAVES